MLCRERGHLDCRRRLGPFDVIDVDTGMNMRVRSNAIHDLARAFDWADRAYANVDRDYVIKNHQGSVIPRPWRRFRASRA